MLNHLLQITPLCFMIAVISVVYIRILAFEPILSKWFRLGATLAWDEKKEKFAWWYKPLFGCEKCFAGQLALWSYLVYMGEWVKGPVWFYLWGSIDHPVHLPYWVAPNYDLICHLYTITGAIALAVLLSAGYNIFKNKAL